MEHLCIICGRPVTSRQQALLCDGDCGRWQHRLCGIPIDQSTYRQIVRGKLFKWQVNRYVTLNIKYKTVTVNIKYIYIYNIK